MLAPPTMVRDRPQVVVGRADDRKLNDERVRRIFERRTRRLGRWRKNLHTRMHTAPRTRHAEATTEAVFATDLRRSNEDRALNFVGDPLPLGRIKGRPWLDCNDPFISIGEHDAAGCVSERKIEFVWIDIPAVKLTRPPMRFSRSNFNSWESRFAQLLRRRFSAIATDLWTFRCTES
jgi:hypothetical protein